jgi:O-antigen/teichoic acid export membrane protein
VIAFAFSDYFATILLNRPEMGYLVRWGSLLIPFQITLDYVTSAFVGLEHMSSVAFLNVLQSVIKVAMSIGLILLGFGVLGALTGQIAGVLVAEIFAVIVLSRNYRGLIQKDANNTLNISFRDNVKALFTYGLPLYLTILTGGLAPQYQTIVLAHFALNEEIGNFRAALNLLTLVTMISAPITTSLFPAFSKLDPESEAIKRFFQLSVKYMTILVVPTTFLVLLFTREITYIAYGSSFTSTALFLFVFCTSYLLVGLGSLVQMEFYKGTANTMVNFRIIMVYFLLLLPLTPLFTFFYGVVGLIIVQLVASFCSITYGLRVAVSRFHIVFQWKDLTKIYIVSTVSALPVTVFSYYFSFWWLWKAIIGTAMYLIVWLTIMPLTNTLKTPELQKIRTLLERIPLFGRILVPIISYEQKLTGKKTVV